MIEDRVVLLTLDKSPQGGREWSNSALRVVDRFDIMACYDDANTLWRTQRTDHPDVLGEQGKAAERLRRFARLEPLTLVAIGSGAAGLIPTIHALAHQAFLEWSSWHEVKRLLEGTSIVLDFGGSESGIATS